LVTYSIRFLKPLTNLGLRRDGLAPSKNQGVSAIERAIEAGVAGASRNASELPPRGPLQSSEHHGKRLLTLPGNRWCVQKLQGGHSVL